MEQAVTKVAQQLSQANTATWRKCPKCEQEYQERAFVGENCYPCDYKRREAARIAEANRRNWIRSLGGEKAYNQMTAEAFQVTAANRAAHKAVTGFDWRTENLYLCGQCGVGKTYLAVLAARKALEAGVPVQLLKTYELLRRVRGRQAEEEQEQIDDLVSLPVFILDDLGVEKATEYAMQILYEIIDRRDMSERSGLIITSNLTIEQLATKLGDDRLPSRLAGLCKVIEIKGSDWRLKS